jgi:SAM-dependent methyltransferase
MSTDPSDTRSRYCGHGYLSENPTWDAEDSPWKAALVAEILAGNGVVPNSMIDIGCGAGGVLAELRRAFPTAQLAGFDVAPDASRFWAAHFGLDIDFCVADFLSERREVVDVALLLDVLEHLADPFSFLVQLRERARYFVFHIPLDLSALSVARETPLLHVRRKVGHVHYFTKGLALELLRESGYAVVDCRFTGAALEAPNRGLLTRIASLPRRLARALAGSEFAARLLGGETLMILARAAL